MNKPYLQLFQNLFPDRFYFTEGEVDITTPSGSLRIPIEFDIYSLDFDLFQALPLNSFVGPCNPAVQNEFVMVEISIQEGPDPNHHHHYGFEDYDPVFAQNFPTLLITWAVNEEKKLYWRAGGFA
jgi:hypothetical protein